MDYGVENISAADSVHGRSLSKDIGFSDSTVNLLQMFHMCALRKPNRQIVIEASCHKIRVPLPITITDRIANAFGPLLMHLYSILRLGD
tara:strand:- start:79 stop:345 length:267 start_codon:yes stop_codon:yes gene_type:complete